MTPTELLPRVACLLEKLRIPYAIVGGQAVIQRGNVRLTEDVDAVVAGTHEAASRIAQAATEMGFVLPAIDIKEFVRKTGVLVLFDENCETHADIVFSFTPFERGLIARATTLEFDGCPVRIATSEDLVLQKMFASRPKDIDDVKAILLRQRGKLDLDYIRHWLPQLAEVSDEPGIVERFEEMLSKYYFPPKGS